MVESKHLPVYDYIDDLVLVGTNHLLDCRKDKDKTCFFLEELKGTKHFILEGRKTSHVWNLNNFNYENLAYSLSTKLSCNVHFIEEGEDFIEANGIRKDFLGFYMCCIFLPQVIESSKNSERLFTSNLANLIQRIDEVYPAADQKTITHQLTEVTKEYPHVNLLCNLARNWAHHSSRNRDHYIFGPKTKKWKEELDGKKFELVGYNHFVFLQKYLRGEEIPPLGHWHEKLDEKHRKIAEDIEKILIPG